MLEEDFSPPPNFALLATLFEASLAIVAVGLGWLLAHPPATTFRPDALDAGIGLAAIVPPLALLGLCLKSRFGPFVRLRGIVDHLLVPLFRQCTLWEIAAISIVAGIGEEMLFRGLIQGGLAEWIGGSAGLWTGLIVGSIVFGLAHAISPTYSVLTALIGLYLGWLWIATGNLLVPIVTHAAYDLVVIAYLAKIRPSRSDRDSQADNPDQETEERNTNY